MYINYNQLTNQNQKLNKQTKDETAASLSKATSSSSSSVIAARTVSISQLQAGQVFEGQIADIRNNAIVIRLANQQNLLATLLESVEMSIGDKMLFQVSDNNGKQISIKPYTEGILSPDNQSAVKALEANKLPINERNIDVVKELMKSQMPLDKQTIQKITGQTAKFPDANISTIITMHKNNIPITKSNVEQFEAYAKAQHQLTDKIQSISNNIVDALTTVGEKGNIGQLLKLNAGLVDAITSSNETLQNQDVKSNILQENNQTKNIENNHIKNTENTQNTNQESKTTNQLSNLLENSQEETKTVFSKEAKTFGNDNSMPIRQVLNEKSLENLKQNIEQLEERTNMKFSEDFKQRLASGEMKSAEFLKQVTNFIESVKLNEGAYSEIKQLLLSNEYKKILKRENTTSNLLDPSQIKDAESIHDFYEKLTSKADKLSEIMRDIGKAGEPIVKDTQSVKDNVDFMKALNQMFQYTQLPMLLKNQNAHGDLYVLTNKKELRKNKEEISVLLHLDMDNLGEVDIFVKMKGKSIGAKFTLNDDISMKLVEDNMKILQEQLAVSGFDLSSEVSKKEKEKKVDFVKDFIGEEAKEDLKRYSFDIRA